MTKGRYLIIIFFTMQDNVKHLAVAPVRATRSRLLPLLPLPDCEDDDEIVTKEDADEDVDRKHWVREEKRFNKRRRLNNYSKRGRIFRVSCLAHIG